MTRFVSSVMEAAAAASSAGAQIEGDAVMDVRLGPGPTRWCVRALVVGLTTSMLAIGATAFAQAPPAAQPKAPPRPSAKSVPLPQASARRTEAQPPAVEVNAPQLSYSPWRKVCLKGQDANARQACFTAKDGRVESGTLVVAAVLIEPEGAGKFLRITLPLGMLVPEGTRVIVDKGQPLTAPYSTCLANGCMADYGASQELIGNMKSGEGLVVQGTNSQGQVMSLVLPLAGFGKAYDGPPIDPKVSEQQQKELRDDLQKRAEEAREKLEQQQQKRLQDDMQKRAEEAREKLEGPRPSLQR